MIDKEEVVPSIMPPTAKNWVIANEVILIYEGLILDNPFEQRFHLRPDLMWVLDNPAKVERLIYGTLHHHNYFKKGNMSDCYSYIVQKMTETKTSYPVYQDMSLEDFCKREVRILAKEYIRFTMQEKSKQVPIIQGESAEEKNQIIEGKQGFFEDMISMEAPEWGLKESLMKEGDLLFEDLVSIYDEYFFITRGLQKFDKEKFFSYTFFNVPELPLEKHLQIVSEKTGISVALLGTILTQLRQDVERNNPDATQIFATIQELTKINKEVDWLPRLLRGEQQ